MERLVADGGILLPIKVHDSGRGRERSSIRVVAGNPAARSAAGACRDGIHHGEIGSVIGIRPAPRQSQANRVGAQAKKRRLSMRRQNHCLMVEKSARRSGSRQCGAACSAGLPGRVDGALVAGPEGCSARLAHTRRAARSACRRNSCTCHAAAKSNHAAIMRLSSTPPMSDDCELTANRTLPRQPLGIILTGLASIAGTWDKDDRGCEGMPRNRTPPRHMTPRPPPSLLSIGIYAEKESHPALFEIGRLTVATIFKLYFLYSQSNLAPNPPVPPCVHASSVSRRHVPNQPVSPKHPEGKARSARNARKHVFNRANFAVIRIESPEIVANLVADAVARNLPADSQEHIAFAQFSLLRRSALESCLFTICPNRSHGNPWRHPDPRERRPDRRNRSHHWTESQLRAGRRLQPHHRRAGEEFDRLKALRHELQENSRNEPIPRPQPVETATTAPAQLPKRTHPHPSPHPASLANPIAARARSLYNCYQLLVLALGG